MAAKDTMKLIISLIILAAGVKAIAVIAKSFIGAPVPGLSPELLGSIDSTSNLLVIGIGVIVLILVPVYLSARSEEKKAQPAKK